MRGNLSAVLLGATLALMLVASCGGDETCARSIDCVQTCGGKVFQSGCAPCPAGTMDSVLACKGGSGGSNGSTNASTNATSTSSGGGQGGQGGSEPSTPKDVALVRVHVLSSKVDALDAATVFTQEQLDGFFEHINKTFEPAGIEWKIESVKTVAALDEQAYLDAVAAEKTGAASLKKNVDVETMLAPKGWDIFVVRKTNKLGFGGVYVCRVTETDGTGAVFVPLQASNGSPQQKRKWSHELGHAMGLPHTPCEPEYADYLMMSASCEYAEEERMTLDEQELARIAKQYEVGGPAVCGTIKLDDR